VTRKIEEIQREMVSLNGTIEIKDKEGLTVIAVEFVSEEKETLDSHIRL